MSLPSRLLFDWDMVLGNKLFSRRLVNSVVPMPLKLQVLKVFSLLDNVTSFEDFQVRFGSFTHEEVINLFDDIEDFLDNVDGVVVALLLPKIISETKNNPDILMTKFQQLNYAKTLLECQLNTDLHHHLVDMLVKPVRTKSGSADGVQQRR